MVSVRPTKGKPALNSRRQRGNDQRSLDFDPPKGDDQTGHQLPPPRTVRRGQLAHLLSISVFASLTPAETTEIDAALAGEVQA